jgi:ferredoxin
MPEFLLRLPVGDLTIAGETGESVLAAAQRAGRPLQTVCKGRGICGACRILVDEIFVNQLAPPSPNETRLLHYLKGEANHRLACQIILNESLSGLRLTPAPLPIRTIT